MINMVGQLRILYLTSLLSLTLIQQAILPQSAALPQAEIFFMPIATVHTTPMARSKKKNVSIRVYAPQYTTCSKDLCINNFPFLTSRSSMALLALSQQPTIRFSEAKHMHMIR